ncbi:MAG: MFS transporter [Chloroflexi bacterium]|nr:MFS transporter [Chloroflexota bacterium]
MFANYKNINWTFITVLIGGCALVMITLGMNHGMGLYLIPITEHLEIGRELFGLSIAIQVLFAGIGAPIFGALADRYGPGKITLLGTLILIVSRYWLANIDNTIDLFGSLFLWGFGAGGFLGIALGAVARTATGRNRSLYVGIVMSAGSFGQFIIVPIINLLIQRVGWMDSLYYMIYLTIALVLFCYFLSFSSGSQANSDNKGQTVGEAIREALSNKNFNLLTLGFFVCGFHVIFVSTHLPAFLEDNLLPAWIAGWALALIGLFNILGTLMYGYLGDSYSKKNLLTGLYSLRSVLFLVFFLSPKTEFTVLIFASLLGILWLSTVPLTSGIITDVFGPKYTSMLFGVALFSHNVGSFFGSWLGGRIFDTYGSYDLMWLICVFVGFASAVVHFPINGSAVLRIKSQRLKVSVAE